MKIKFNMTGAFAKFLTFMINEFDGTDDVDEIMITVAKEIRDRIMNDAANMIVDLPSHAELRAFIDSIDGIRWE